MDVLTLDIRGIILAFLLAILMLIISLFTVIGIYAGVFFVIAMVYFLALSAIATRTGSKYKHSIKQYQKTRGVKNVLANGLGPLIFVILAIFAGHNPVLVSAVLLGFIASVAAVTSDKFSSEVGILDGTPTSIVTGKKVRKGTSGGVTLVGLTAALLSSFMVALVLVFGYFLWFFQIAAVPFLSGIGTAIFSMIIVMILIGTFAGFMGSIIDSLLGYYEELGIGNKYTSNFLCSVAGGAIATGLYFLLLVI
jgi:uncharacterized protein (TIGR00297 family)